MKIYLWTLDSHDCFGPFEAHDIAREWAKETNHTSFALTHMVPHETIKVHEPYEPYVAPAKYGC